ARAPDLRETTRAQRWPRECTRDRTKRNLNHTEILTMHTLTLDTPVFETLDLSQLDSITGGDAVDTGGQVGELIGKYAGAGAGAVGGAALGGLVTTPTVAGVPVGVTAGAGIGGAAGYDLGGTVGKAVGRGAVQGAQWVGNQAQNAWNGARRLTGW
ncbi:MAG TPA: hypothetical protein VIV58_17795, partial [Kofleriaceae bacterium]